MKRAATGITIVSFQIEQRGQTNMKRRRGFTYLCPIRFQLNRFFGIVVCIVQLFQLEKSQRSITVQRCIVRTQFDGKRIV